jgi:hypothetical protein
MKTSLSGCLPNETARSPIAVAEQAFEATDICPDLMRQHRVEAGFPSAPAHRHR